MTALLKILIAEDSSEDVEMLVLALRRAGFEFECQVVATEVDYVRHLHPELDIILSDYAMPQFDGMRALELLRERGLEIPFVIISGTIGEEVAVSAMKQGAADYLIKDRLGRLGPAVTQAIAQGRMIKERRKTEAALQLFRDLVDQADDTFEVIDPETSQFLDVNAKGPAEIGCTREEYLAMRVIDLDPTVDAARWARIARDLREVGSRRSEAYHQRKDGTAFPVEICAKWVQLDRDYIVAAVRDLTSRRQAEKELRESERRFRDLLENVELIAMNLDRDGAVTFCNDCLLRMTGWSREEVVGMDWSSKFIPGTPEERRLFRDNIRTGKIPAHHENPIVTRDGHLRDIVWNNTTLRDQAGNFAGMASLGEDVTERKRTEERIREQAAMLDLTRDAIVVRGFQDRRITFWSHGAEILYEWNVAEAMGRDIGELICADPAAPDEIREALLQHGEWRGEVQHVTRNGKRLMMNCRATLVRGAAGEPKSVLSINTDITEQKELEARFLRTQRMESIGTLASGVAHDLNNILSPIMMSVPVLRHNLTTEQREEIISTIEVSAARGAQIVKQVLTFGQGLEGERRPLQITSLISEMVKISRETFPKNISVNHVNEPMVWPVLGDATQLHQILLNLCVNARDALPHGGEILLGARNVDVDASYASMLPEAAPGPHILLEVSDTGTGMAPEIIERIFDPFFTTKGIGKGTGLGLSTVLGIVKSHRGFVHVKSQTGKGTTFQVFLPAAPDSEPVLVGAVEAPVPEGQGELVLVVDDEAGVRTSVHRALETHGYRVLLAVDGIDALRQCAMNVRDIALVLTDLMMPSMDGLTLVRAIRAIMPKVPVVASTGLGEKALLAQLTGLGVEAVLHKPFAADTLLRVIHDTLHPAVASPAPGL